MSKALIPVNGALAVPVGDLDAYMQAAYGVPILSQDEELGLARRFHLGKVQSCSTRAASPRSIPQVRSCCANWNRAFAAPDARSRARAFRSNKLLFWSS